MLAGELYDASDAELTADRQRAHSLCQKLNALPAGADEDKSRVLTSLFGRAVAANITPPFFCDYGYNIDLGHNAYLNFNCVVLDVAHVQIGSNTLFGPGVHIYAATHPMLVAQRRTGLEMGSPVSIEDDVWVGGGTIVCPGITIGKGSVIGAGSVVTRSVPPGVFAAGNPCRVIRKL
jgi:maltose O-acetyltransferase